MNHAAILGMGRSGLSALVACRSAGIKAIVLEQKVESEALKSELLPKFESLRPEIAFGVDDSWDFKGIDTLIVSPGVAKSNPLLLDAIRQNVDLISEIELAYRISKSPIVAVTGTNGKSTTAVMTFLCLRAAGAEAVLCGNIFGSGYDERPLTEAASEGKIGQYLVAEISSFQLEWIREFRPRAALITNITDDHLNRYRSFSEYAETKHRLFENMADGDAAIWHYGDGLTKPIAPRAKLFTYGDAGCDAWTSETELTLVGTSIRKSQLPFGEAHNILNAQGAALLAYGATQESVSPTKILAGLTEFKGLRHRMERLGARNGVEVINNSMCTNPVAVVSSSQSIPNRQHLLIGGVDKDMSYAPLRDFLKNSDHEVYLFGRDAELIARQLEDDYPVFETMDEAFFEAAGAAKSGETIMLAPGAASLDQFVDFRDRGDRFVRIAKEWLNS